MSCDCGIWTSKAAVLEDASKDQTIDVPNGHYIHEIVVQQGSTGVGTAATLALTAPGRLGSAVLTLAAGAVTGKHASASNIYAPRVPTSTLAGADVSGTTRPIYLPSGGVRCVLGATIASGGSVSVQVRSAPYPPPRS